jgi:hypothetical protein
MLEMWQALATGLGTNTSSHSEQGKAIVADEVIDKRHWGFGLTPWRIREHCFLMKSEIFLWRYSQSCSGFCKKRSSSGWEAAGHIALMFAWWRRRTET